MEQRVKKRIVSRMLFKYMYHFYVIFFSRRYARWINKEIFRCMEGIGEGEIAFVCSCFVFFTENILI